jgi:uncharacterized protein (TIRG00374 family)
LPEQAVPEPPVPGQSVPGQSVPGQSVPEYRIPLAPETEPILARPPGPHTEALHSAIVAGASDPTTTSDYGDVRVVDAPEPRVHHPSNVVGMLGAVLGIALVLLLAAFARGTTEDLADGVREFSTLLADFLFVPLVNILEGLVTVVVPIAVVVELAVRRMGRQVVESIVAAVVGLAAGLAALQLLNHVAGQAITDAFTAVVHGQARLTLPAYVAAITALLLVAGPRTRRKSVQWSWNLLIAAVIFVLLMDLVALPGAIVALLIGVLAGNAVKYVSGVVSERAYGPELISALRMAGFSPTALVRIRDIGAASGITAEGIEDAVSHSSDSAALALARAGENTRVYAMLAHPPGSLSLRSDGLLSAAESSPHGGRYDVVVLDGDRQVIGLMARWWRALRLRGFDSRSSLNLRSVAERTALMHYAAAGAGVRAPRLLGVGMADDSAVLVVEHARGAVSLRDMSAEDLASSLGDTVANEAWKQLRRAHDAGLTHHRLTPDTLLAGTTQSGRSAVWITGWEQGEIASSTLSKRFDITQMLALLSLRIGPRRAVSSAVRGLPDADIAAIGPLLQAVALPDPVRAEFKESKNTLKDLREALVEQLPEADLSPERIARFGARTIIMLTLSIVAIGVVVTTINFDEITSAVQDANPLWVGAALALACFTWFGAALTLVAFSPGDIPVFKAMLAQMAGSFVALATPAGIGPAALNMRFVAKRGVPTAMAVATAALMQVSQIVVTVILLVVLTLTTGSGALVALPSGTVLIAVGLVAVVIVALLLVPPVRHWVWERVRPTLEQLWPRLSQMLSQPTRLVLGLGGNVIQTAAYVLAFDAAVHAFGHSLHIVDVAVIYLVGNSIGALVPTPGGLGGVEGALIAGLTAAGIPPALAVSSTLLFRVVSYWVRIPLGWIGMRRLESQGDL